uniref:Protein arginine methyltransferase NDUFAF7 n=1 Tax=Araucaria cunninghamii TaxID=56994 RepID=A0A0D6R0S9_ARACU
MKAVILLLLLGRLSQSIAQACIIPQLVGAWSVCLWQQMGEPKQVNLVELGPGRGTLMADLLRGTAKFKEFSEALSVRLVECSPALRKLQHSVLQCTEVEAQKDDRKVGDAFSTFSGVPVSWHVDLEQVPKGVPTIIIAHEFYDALPIHQFQKTPRGWTEKLIDIAEDSDGFRFVLSPEPTAATKLYLAKRIKRLSLDEISKLEHVEVCPQAIELTKNIGKRVELDGGGALIIDYGQNGVISDSLQAIRNHKFVHVLDDPGTADLSDYVDFAYVRHVVEEMTGEVAALGPISQSRFLGALGINFRLEALLQNATDEQAEALQVGYWKLVGDGPAPFWEGEDELTPIGMGSRYLALAIVNKKIGAPACFE